MENRSKQKLFRWAVCFLSIILITLQFSFPAQAATCPDGQHNWVLDTDTYSPPDCWYNGHALYQCSKCGSWKRETIPTSGHSWSEWKQVVMYNDDGTIKQGDCTKGLYQYRTCSACGTTEYRTKEPWTHNFDPWVTVRNGTCIQEGLMRRTCVDCGIYEEVSTGYGGHNYGNWVEMQPPTCTAQGIKYADCQICGHREYLYTDPVPHTFGEWSVKTAATDLTAGVRKRSCTVCHLEQEEVYYPDGTVFYGENNNIVYELQEALNRGGYDCGTPDGAFGNNTWTAITEFEGDHDLPVDGIGWPGIRRILAEEEQTGRTSRDSEDSGSPDDPSKTVSFRNNSTGASLVCSLKEHPAYIPEDRDYYYLHEPVVLWVNFENDSSSLIEDVYCYNDDTGFKAFYDIHLYPDWKAGNNFYQKKLEAGDNTSFMLYYEITPEDVVFEKHVFRYYVSGKDLSGNSVQSEVAKLVVKTANLYNDTSRQTKDPPKEPTIELRESTQAGHWMEDPADPNGIYYYAKGEEIRYKILVKNDTAEPIYNVVIGYDFQPVNIKPVILPGQKEEDLAYELPPEGDNHIIIEAMEPGEQRAFYIWCAVKIGSEKDNTMEHYASMEYTIYGAHGGDRKYIKSAPCVVNTGIDPNAGSEK